MSVIDYPLVFSFGLLGSLHCVQMCGPLVLAYSLPLAGAAGDERRRDLVLAHLAYNAGRITTYALLGALAGATGHALGLLGRIAGIANAAAIAAGVLLILTGLAFAGALPTNALIRLDPTRILGRLHRGVTALMTKPTRGSKFTLGLALGFLPCGFLYAGLLKAVESGGPLSGALTMTAFGLGTAGALILTGLFSSAITAPLRRWGNILAAAAMILLGSLLLYRGLMARGMLPPSSPGEPQQPHGYRH
jgi:hypothetical protein